MSLLTKVLERLSSPVAVLYGGTSEERAVSIDSGTAVIRALAELDIPFVALDTQQAWQDKIQQKAIKHALIFLHGGEGENGMVQAKLDALGISYAGSGVDASALAMDKVASKAVWNKLAISTPPSLVKRFGDDLSDVFPTLGRAVIVKPAHEGSSVGMAIAQTGAELVRAVNDAARFDTTVLIESLLEGPEYTVGILGQRCLPSIMLQPDGVFYDYEAKYISNNTRYICPADVEPNEQQQLNELALKAFHALGCDGWGRVDIMAHHHRFYVLEVNTIPGMTSHSLVPKAAAAAGIDFNSLVLQILASSVGVSDA